MKKIHFLLVLFLLSIHGVLHAQSVNKSFGSVTLAPTVAFVKYKGEIRRVVRLVFNDGKAYDGGTLIVNFNQKQESLAIPADKNGLESYEVPLPGANVEIATQAMVSFKSGRQSYIARCIVEPARKNWTVYVLPHSHVDIGYTNTQDKVLKLHMDNIDESIALA